MTSEFERHAFLRRFAALAPEHQDGVELVMDALLVATETEQKAIADLIATTPMRFEAIVQLAGQILGRGAKTEAPDFEQIARKLVESFDPMAEPFVEDVRVPIAEQLRQVWNARGAADLAALQDIAGPTGVELSMDDDVIPALRGLDR